MKPRGPDIKTRVKYGLICTILISLVTVPVSLFMIVLAERNPVEVYFGRGMHFLELLIIAVACFFIGVGIAPGKKRKGR